MASNLQLYSGSPLIGSPILYQVTSATPVGDINFHRIKLVVSAGLSSDGTQQGDVQWQTFDFSQPVGNGETVYIDISSALVAVADKYVYTPEPPAAYPYIAFSLKACDDYMQNGIVYENVGEVTNPGGKALMGAFSDRERLAARLSGRTTKKFSRKPVSSTELVTVGEKYLRAESMSVGIGNITSGQKMHSYTIEGEGVHILSCGDEEIKVYAVPASSDRYQIRFMNGLGVVESISVQTLRTTEMPVTQDEYTVSRQQMFNEVSRGIIIKQNDYERWKMSSGPLDRHWQQWFLHEFLTTEKAWISIDDMWIPCSVVPEETVTGIDRQKASLLEVQFTLKFDITGSPFGSMAI